MRPGGIGIAVAAMIISVMAFGMPLRWLIKAERAPPIHDISTDTENPPAFSAILPLRKGAVNSAEYGGPGVAALQRRAYPDIKPVYPGFPTDKVFGAALKAAGDRDWKVVYFNLPEGRIEATDETFWFGFKDDIVVRITPEGTGARLDVRSVSRVGVSDLGTNAKRIRDYINEVRRNLSSIAFPSTG